MINPKHGDTKCFILRLGKKNHKSRIKFKKTSILVRTWLFFCRKRNSSRKHVLNKHTQTARQAVASLKCLPSVWGVPNPNPVPSSQQSKSPQGEQRCQLFPCS